MAHNESEYRFTDFQEIISYPDYALTPPTVCTNTARNLDFYLHSGDLNKSYAQEYFRDVTLQFLESSERGFLDRYQKLDPLGLISVRDRAMLEWARQQDDTPVTPLDREAFDYTFVVFSALPELAEHEMLPNGYSRRGLLRPPSTVMEGWRRINEMKRVMARFATGDVDPEIPVETNAAVWRGTEFFHAASKLPFVVNEQPKLIALQVKNAWDQWLDGIDFKGI